MGLFVDKLPQEPFEGEFASGFSGTGSDTTKNIVSSRFDTSLANTEEMKVLLFGYLESLNDMIATSITWTEQSFDASLFPTLLARLLTDLQSGATGLSATVEQEIIDRAQARQDVIDDKHEQETLEFFASRGFTLPTGAMQAAIAELANERARNRADLNGKTLIMQAELAQKNSQFIINAAKEVESILRESVNKLNDRRLDLAKAIAQLREKIVEAMANIGMQSVASWAGAVNVSAGLSHSTGRHESESFSHSESRSAGFSIGNSLSESHGYEEA